MSKSRAHITGLGIESTAHTFGASVVNSNKEILSDIRAIYQPVPGSGIHPREASRHHSSIAAKVVSKALNESGCKTREIDFIAYSAGPGLGPCLRVGSVVARSLASYLNIPLIPVNHAIAHIELAAMLTGAVLPVVLLVSGGHTLITLCSSGRWRIFGETLDLTVGQLLDQFGREAGFSSPSGKRIEEIARTSENYVLLPYTVKGNDASFSGILTTVKKLLQKGGRMKDLSYSIQETAFAMLAEVTERAMAFAEAKELLLAGGVAANTRLQTMLQNVCERQGAAFYVVPLKYSGDCGAQIAWTGLLGFQFSQTVQIEKSIIRQSWRIDQVDVPWRS
jgi:N6-L-threonylcarbamoyladenine synthase